MQSNNFYRAFEDRYRGSRELIKGRLNVYLPFINPLKDIYKERPILDLGCGRGEWLELAQESGFEAHGVDLDEGMLAACRERGLSVKTQDAITALKQLHDHSLAIISGFHIAEHLHFDALQELVQEALRVLKPAGLLILETPNPENIVVGTSNFYLDPTHQRPLPPPLLSFLAEHTGFSRTKIIRLQESPDLVGASTIDLLNVINGVSPDYAIIAQSGAAPELLEKFDEPFEKKYGLMLDTLAAKYDSGIQNRFSKIEALIKKTESHAQQAESHAQQAESHAQQAESRAQQAESRAQQAESRAEELHTTLRAVYTSHSWRLTYPLRWLNLQKNLLFQHGLVERAKALLKKISHPILFRVLFFFEGRPAWRQRAVHWANCLGLGTHLRSIYWRIKTFSTPFHSQAKAPNSKVQHSPQNADQALIKLSPRARRIYAQLKTIAIERQQKENG